MSERIGSHRHALDVVPGELDGTDGSVSEELEDVPANSKTSGQSPSCPALPIILVQIAGVDGHNGERHTAAEHYVNTFRDSEQIGSQALIA